MPHEIGLDSTLRCFNGPLLLRNSLIYIIDFFFSINTAFEVNINCTSLNKYKHGVLDRKTKYLFLDRLQQNCQRPTHIPTFSHPGDFTSRPPFRPPPKCVVIYPGISGIIPYTHECPCWAKARNDPDRMYPMYPINLPNQCTQLIYPINLPNCN